MANLVNFGILPLTFASKQDYDNVTQGDTLELNIDGLKETLTAVNKTKNTKIKINLNLSEQEKSQIKAGGNLAAIKAKQKK